MKRVGWALVLGLGTASRMFAADTGETPTLKTGKEGVPSVVAAELKRTLAPESFTVERQGASLYRFWLRANIPATGADNPLGYDKIDEGTFVGVVEVFSDKLEDYRAQGLKPGVFTLRMGIQPADGNHMGTAPTSEFLCLCPAKKDEKLEAIKHDPLMKLSKEAAGTGHPTVLYLQPFSEPPTFSLPAINANSDQQVVLNLRAKGTYQEKSFDFPLGMVVIGVSPAH